MDKYKKIFEKLEPTDTQIQKIKHKVNSKLEESEGGKMKKTKRLALTILAICMLITTTAFATNDSKIVAEVLEFLGLSDSTFSFFGIEDEKQKEDLSQGAHILDDIVEEDEVIQTEEPKADIGIMQESTGGTIHFKEVVGDENLIYIFFDFYAPKGTVLDKGFYHFDSYLMTDGVSDVKEYGAFRKHISYGINQLEDDDKTDNKLPMVFQIITEDVIEQDTIFLQIENLRGFTDDEHYSNFIKTQYSDRTKEVLRLTEEDLMLSMPEEEIFSKLEAYDGIWTYEFSADIESDTKYYELDAVVPIGEGYVKFTNLSISPISATLIGSTNVESEFTSAEEMALTVNYADGTSYTDYCSGSWGGQTMHLLQFETVVDKEIVSITYQGHEIALN